LIVSAGRRSAGRFGIFARWLTKKVAPDAGKGQSRSLILFLCSGNFYRSRFAEELYRALSGGQAVSSRGLLEDCGLADTGAMSPHALRQLARRGIPVSRPRAPRHVTEADLAAASMIIAMNEPEHRPLVERRFPAWADRVTYWTIEDVDVTPPEEALPEIERLVYVLLDGKQEG
jgi:protein-tyrosine phosphatase